MKKGVRKSKNVEDFRSPASKMGAMAPHDMSALLKKVNISPMSAQAGFHNMEDAAQRDRVKLIERKRKR